MKVLENKLQQTKVAPISYGDRGLGEPEGNSSGHDLTHTGDQVSSQ